MSKNHLRAAFIGGLIVFIWCMFSWMVLPCHHTFIKKFTSESAVADVIQENAPSSGIYQLPNTYAYNENTDKDEISSGMKMIEKGPYMFASVRTMGMGRMNILSLVYSLILQIIGAFIVVWMLMQAKGLSFRKQVEFVTLFGVAVGLLGLVPDWIWWGFPGCFVFVKIIDLAVGWFLAGLCIAKVLRK